MTEERQKELYLKILELERDLINKRIELEEIIVKIQDLKEELDK